MASTAPQRPQSATSITVTPVSGALGAELSGVDLGAGLSDEVIHSIHRALLDHGVIFFRDQDFDTEAHKRLARRFGDIFHHPFLISDDPDVLTIVRNPEDTRIVGEDWHSDTQMVEAPPMGAILMALEVPATGGDTLFANQYLAYEALSDGMKSMLDGLRAVNSDLLVAGPAAADRSNNRATKSRTGPDWAETRCCHPIVRTHPETRRKCLYVNHSYTVGIEGMTEDESRPLLGRGWRWQRVRTEKRSLTRAWIGSSS